MDHLLWIRPLPMELFSRISCERVSTPLRMARIHLSAKWLANLEKMGQNYAVNAVEKLITEDRDGKPCVTGVQVNGRKIQCGAVLSNANLKNTIENMLGLTKLPEKFANKSKSVRLNNTRVYIGLKRGPPYLSPLEI